VISGFGAKDMSATMQLFARLVVAIGLAIAAGDIAAAQDKYPSKPVTIVVPFPPGGGTDVGTRLVAAKLSERWGQTVVVENKPGASGIIGADAVSKARPDGYTLLAGNIGTQSINPLIYAKLPYNADAAFMPIAQINQLPLVLVVHPGLPVTSLAELVALAKSQPKSFTYASSGTGGSPHLAAALLESMAGLDLLHVAYKGGGPAVQDVMGGHVRMLFATVLETSGHIRSGKLKALAVTSEARTAALPDIPTVSESGYPGYAANSWLGLLAPAGTPPALVEQISADVQWAVGQADVRDKFIAQGATPMAKNAAGFAGTIAQDRARYTKIVADKGIKAD
jgi:tripartite-type tricarboxylate transporter receptor subunit TctC